MRRLVGLTLITGLGVGLGVLPWVVPAAAQQAPARPGEQPGPNQGDPKQPDGNGGHHHEPVRNLDEAKQRFNPHNDPNITISDNGDGTYAYRHTFR